MKDVPSNTSASLAKPTIVQIVGYYPPHLGGMEVVVREVSLTLAKSGWPVEVITSTIGAGYAARSEHQRNHKLWRLRTLEFAHTPFMPGLVWRLWRVKKPAIFHLHLSQAYLPEVVWLVAKLRQIPYVVHFHLDTEPSGRLGFLFILYKKFVQPGIMRGAAQVITLSPEQADLVCKRYHIKRSKVSFIPNGVSQKFLKIPSENKRPHTPLRLLFVGRLSPQKRVDRLLEALALTKAKVHLSIVGDGEDRQKLEALAEKLGLRNVVFRGPLSRNKLVTAYKQADVFVLPSDKEGMPLALLEAMAAGLPVIGSDVQGIREHLTGSGILVPHPSPKTFATALDNFYQQRQTWFPILSQASRDKAALHTWPKLVQQLTKLYTTMARRQAPWRLTRSGLVAAAIAWWLAFLGLRAIQQVPAPVVDVIGFSFLILVPGILTVLCLRLTALATYGKLALAIGFSILELLTLGLAGNTVLQWVGIKRPLDAPYLIAEISLLLAVLAVLAWVRLRAWKFKPRTAYTQLFPTRLDRYFSAIPLLFVLLSVLGAISLNNGGTDALTMTMLIATAGFCLAIVYKSKRLTEATILNALFLMSLSLLLMTSLRGWYVTGHDIQLEYRVFQLARTNGVWQIQSYRDPYNACLSITILPTIFANLLKIFDPYVYKALFPILFSVCPAVIYLLVRKWTSAALAFLATLYFISFPTFFTDMPYLNRQAIAFIFVALMFYIIFQDQLRLKLRRILFLVLGVGLILSHYSTTYSIIVILILAAGSWPIMMKIITKLKGRRLFKDSALLAIQSSARESKRITVGMLIILACASFLWTTILTDTGSNTALVIKQTFAAIGDSFQENAPKSNSTDYNLFSFHSVSPAQELSEYVKNDVKTVRAEDPGAYYPAATYNQYPLTIASDEVQPLTGLGRTLTKHGLNVVAFNLVFRQASAKLLQVLVLSGLIYVLFRRTYTRLLDSDLINLAVASIIFVALQVVLPVLSVQYGLLRAFQQSLMLLGLFTVLGSLALFAWLPSRLLKFGVPAFLAVLFFLSSTGVITQALGGYYAQLNLNNAGTYYDIYYTHAQEIAGIDWLNGVASQQTDVQADQFTFNKLVNYSNLDITGDTYPGLIRRDSYVFLGYSNVHKNQATVSYNDDLLTYTYPTQFLSQQKNLIYSNGGVDIYR